MLSPPSHRQDNPRRVSIGQPPADPIDGLEDGEVISMYLYADTETIEAANRLVKYYF